MSNAVEVIADEETPQELAYPVLELWEVFSLARDKAFEAPTSIEALAEELKPQNISETQISHLFATHFMGSSFFEHNPDTGEYSLSKENEMAVGRTIDQIKALPNFRTQYDTKYGNGAFIERFGEPRADK